MTTSQITRRSASTTPEQFTPGLGIDIWSQSAITDAESVLGVVTRYPLPAPEAQQALQCLQRGAECLRAVRAQHCVAQAPVAATVLPDSVFTAIVRQELANVRTAVSHLLGVPAFLRVLDQGDRSALAAMQDAALRLSKHL